MRKFTFPFVTLALAGVALVVAPLSTPAQNRPKATAVKKAPAQTNAPTSTARKPVAGPFNGKLAGIDKVAKTIKVGKRTFQITSKTRLRKASRPATLDDAVVGEKCSGYVKPTADGKWLATTVNFGPKPKTSDNARTAKPRAKADQ